MISVAGEQHHKGNNYDHFAVSMKIRELFDCLVKLGISQGIEGGHL